MKLSEWFVAFFEALGDGQTWIAIIIIAVIFVSLNAAGILVF